MGMRDWLIIIVIVGIVIILADGYRRKHKNSIRMKLDKNIPPADSFEDDPLERAELPNGGARVLDRHGKPLGAYADAESDDDEDYDDDYYDEQENTEQAREYINDKDNVPVLMDAIDIAGTESKNEPEVKARHHNDASVNAYADETIEEADESFETDSTVDNSYADDDENIAGYDSAESDDEPQYADSSDYEPEPVTHVSTDEYADEAYDDDDISNDEIVSRVRVNHRDMATEKPRQNRQGRIEPSMGEMEPLSAEDLEDRPAHLRELKKQDKKAKKSRFFKSGKAEAGAEKNKGKEKDSAVVQTELFSDTPEDYFQEDEEDAQAVEPEEVIVINVMARKDEYFSGKDLLPIILQQGMQLGKMSIFHKHADGDGNSPIMFSMANMVKPGTFDISQMDEFTTPGVSFFLQLPNSLGNMKCFEQMLKAANHIRETLHGELKDEHRSVITRQTIEHCRQRIQDFELAQLSKK
tara:strand:+ start:104989 stop:106395 length:1407 start_codon:yes stop_codon:yes gene_type:complete